MTRCIANLVLSAILLLVTYTAIAADAAMAPFSIVVARDEAARHTPAQFGESAFSMQMTTWLDGSAIQLVVLPPSSEIQYQFTRQVLNLAPYQAQTRWLRYVYSGQALKPIVVQNMMQMIETVSRIPGAVGFIPAAMPVPDELQVLP